MRVAIVTGAARGIGAGIAEALSKAGWRVERFDILKNAGVTFCDVSDERSVKTAVASLNLKTLDLLVNNAAIANCYSGKLEELSLADWNRTITTNLTGPMLMSRETAPLLRAAKGSIINITSTRAFMSEPNSEAYAASKGGLTALTHSMAASLAPDVRVNAIAPGWIHTGGEELTTEDHAQHWSGRVGTPEDIAGAVLYLASAPFVTGETVVVDGGMTRKMIYAE